MPEILDETERPNHLCPVRSFQNYIGHLKLKCQYLWQSPNDAASYKGQIIWYNNSRVGVNKLGTFMQDICTTLKLQNYYTNHCVRVTGVTGHKSVNSLAIYQPVKADEKMMMGISLASNLFGKLPQEVEAPSPKRLALHTPAMVQAPTTSKLQPVTEADLNQAIVSLQKEVPKQHDLSFDILDFMSDANSDDILMAATCMENQYKHQMSKTTKTMTVVEKSPKKPHPMQSLPNFSGCKIGTDVVRTF